MKDGQQHGGDVIVDYAEISGDEVKPNMCPF